MVTADIEVRIVLSMDALTAEWLKAYLQNKRGEAESLEDANMRSEIFSAFPWPSDIRSQLSKR
jgi:hypothetical protein